MRTLPKRAFIGTLLALLTTLSHAEAAVPDSPAGRAFTMWLEAFNSGDRARLQSFIKTYEPARNPDDYMGWRAETGPYDLLEIFASDQRNIFFHVKAKTSGVEEVGRLTLSANQPAVVTQLGSWRMPAGAKVDAVRLDAKARSKVIDGVAEAFEDSYVFPEIGKKISDALRKRDARGEYRTLLYGEDLARRLAGDLQEISHDKHVDVRFSYVVRPDASTGQSDVESKRLVAVNCGFEKAEHLAPNIGYVKFDLFADAGVCGPTAGAAMTLLADSDALILDLRDNRGGGGGMVEFVASYLFDERTHLEDIYSRVDDATTEFWTLPFVPGKKFLGKPVFVLTSNQTFSAAESLSYSLKNLKRATLVGETTLGGAHPTNTKPIDEHFSARVPYARSISPITKTNWEGTGIEPDVKVPAAEALDVARKLAVEAIDENRATLHP